MHGDEQAGLAQPVANQSGDVRERIRLDVRCVGAASANRGKRMAIDATALEANARGPATIFVAGVGTRRYAGSCNATRHGRELRR